MVFTSPESPKRHANGFLEGVSAVVAVLARRANRLKQKMKMAASDSDWAMEVKSSPKKLLSSISNKALSFGHNKRKLKGGQHGPESGEEEWGDGGVWQKAILMGDKCQPLDFSGAIYYDSTGKLMNGAPLRSPRASPLPGYLRRPREHMP